MNSHAWTAAGWTMLQVGWIGAGIGLIAALGRRLMYDARPEARYALALVAFTTLVVAPAPVFWLCMRDSSEGVAETSEPIARGHAPALFASGFDAEAVRDVKPRSLGPEVQTLERTSEPGPTWLDRLVGALPAVWVGGSALSLLRLLMGLIGVEGLRRSSRRMESGAIAAQCRALAEGLGLARAVGVAVCERIASPVLVGLVKPVILLPPAALTGWSVAQIEMVLLHELAHLRRWDNLINLFQRMGEVVLFFHPAAWWLSGWARLERELCCDRLVVERTARPTDYAELLVALAGSQRRHAALMAMADRQILARVRRILNMEERTMLSLAMPEGLIGIAGPLAVAAALALGTLAPPLPPPGADEPTGTLSTEAQSLRRIADRAAAVARMMTPSNPRDDVVRSIAERQIRLGDLAGARQTLASAPAIDESPLTLGEDRLESFVSACQVAGTLREAGDADGARAMLKTLTAQLEGMPVEDSDSKVGPAGDGEIMRVDTPSSAMMQAELFWYIVEERLKLGDHADAARLARRGVALSEKDAQMGPVVRAAFAEILHRGGDAAGAAEAIQIAHEHASKIADQATRERTLAYVSQYLFKMGERDKGIEILLALPDKARAFGLRQSAESFAETDPDDPIGWLDLSGIKLLVGAACLKVTQAERARAGLAAIATAAESIDSPTLKATLLSFVADLQAKAGDFERAALTASMIPSIDGAPEESYGDALRPATQALVARRLHQAGNGDEAERLFHVAESRAREIAHPRERIVAQLVIARERAACGADGPALMILDDTLVLALQQAEPLRSRTLAMLAGEYLEVDNLSRAEQAAEAARVYPGLERNRAWNAIAWHVLKEQGNDAARSYYSRAYRAVSTPPQPGPPPVGPKPRAEISYGRDTFIDPEVELPAGRAEYDRESAARYARVQLGEEGGVLREVERLPLPPGRAMNGRNEALAAVISKLVIAGKVDEAIAVAEGAETPGERLFGLQQAAFLIERRTERK